MLQRRQRRRREADEQLRSPPPNPSLLSCAELVLPWLDQSELANVSLTCTALRRASDSITLRRSQDASRGFEKLPVPFINSVDPLPYAYFLYAPSQLLHPLNRQPWGYTIPNSLSRVGDGNFNRDIPSACGCRTCGDGSSCPCRSLEGSEGIATECGPSCGCELDCRNRVTQRGVSVKLKIVRVAGKGWGLFADQPIRQGQFVCEYAGELITTKEAWKRQQDYDRLSSESGRNFSSALLVVREHLPSGNACLRLNIDATRVGNVARFINHSCDGGNLSTMLVRSTGVLIPRLCFFASKDIAEGEELSFSYGDSRVGPEGSPCFCGSSCCPGTLPSEHT